MSGNLSNNSAGGLLSFKNIMDHLNGQELLGIFQEPDGKYEKAIFKSEIKVTKLNLVKTTRVKPME